MWALSHLFRIVTLVALFLFLVFVFSSGLNLVVKVWLGVMLVVIGCPICVVAGIFLDLLFNPFNRPRTFTAEEKQEYNKSLFQLAGYIARGANVITKEQITLVELYFQQYQFTPETKKLCIENFNIGKAEGYDPTEACHNLRKYQNYDRNCMHRNLEFLIGIIYADGIVTPEENLRIKKVASLLQVEEFIVRRLMMQAQALYEFRRFYQQQNTSYNYYEEARSRGDNYNHGYVPHDEVENAFKVLGVSPNSTYAQVHKAYVKLIKKYHPDRLTAQGISDEVKADYEERAKAISAAHEVLVNYFKEKGELKR